MTETKQEAPPPPLQDEGRDDDIPPRSYQPYATTYLETPLVRILLKPLCCFQCCLQPLLLKLYTVRSLVALPLRTPLIPHCLAAGCKYNKYFYNVTVGDLLLLAPLVALFLRGIHYTVAAPSLANSGRMASYALYLTFVTASKSNAPLTFLLGISYDRLIGSLHRWSAVCAGVLAGCHVSVIYRFQQHQKEADEEGAATTVVRVWDFLWNRGQDNWSGTVLISTMMAMTLLSLVPTIRRHAYQLWYTSHILLGVAVLVTLFLHSVFSAFFVTLWWALDGLVRYGVLLRESTTTADLRILPHSAGGGGDHHKKEGEHPAVVELTIQTPPGFHYQAGQFVRIAIPAISSVELHPISISSAPHQLELLTLHVRRLGDWTDRLVQLAETHSTTAIRMEGPYGSLSVDLQDDRKYKMVLLVSGGIGVTPCQSIAKDVLYQHRHHGRNLKRLSLVWAVRDLQMVRDIPPILLKDEPQDDYSIRSPEYIRMTERSSQFLNSKSEDAPVLDMSCPKTQRRRPAVVQADIYCTTTKQRTTERDTEAPNNSISQEQLPYNVHQGRPDLDRIFQDMKSAAVSLGESNVAVIGCGPPSLMASLQEACRKHSASVVSMQKDGVFFDLHREHFDL